MTAHTAPKRNGLAPLELVMVLPIVWLLFICVLYVGWSAMIAFQNETLCRNAAWKQRTEGESDARPFVFADSEAGRIDERRSEPIKTGLILDRWNKKAEARHIVLARTWDYRDVPLDKSQLFRQEPVPRLMSSDNISQALNLENLVTGFAKKFLEFGVDAIKSSIEKEWGFDFEQSKSKFEADADQAKKEMDEAEKEATGGGSVSLESVESLAQSSKADENKLKGELDAIPSRHGVNLASLAIERMDGYDEENSKDSKTAFDNAFAKERRAHEERQKELEKEYEEYVKENAESETVKTKEEFMEEKRNSETGAQETNRLVVENTKLMHDYWKAKSDAENADEMINSMKQMQDYKPSFLDVEGYYD